MPACGGNGGGNGGGDDTASERAIEPEAQERAESIVLKLTDFPNGWRASAAEEDESQNEFNKCIGVDYSGLTRIGDAESQDFAKGDSTEASSEVAVFESDQQAEDGMSEYATGMSSSAAEDCFQDLIEEALRGEKGFKLGEVDVGELSFTPPDVDEAKAWQIVVPVEITSGAGEGFSADAYVEQVMLREGDTVASVTTQDVLTEFDPELRNQLFRRSPTVCPSRPPTVGARLRKTGPRPSTTAPRCLEWRDPGTAPGQHRVAYFASLAHLARLTMRILHG